MWVKVHFSREKWLIVLFQLSHMEENVVNNVEHPTNEQNADVNNQTTENSIQNQSTFEETGRVIVRRKPKPMRPTPLYIFLFHPFSNE